MKRLLLIIACVMALVATTRIQARGGISDLMPGAGPEGQAQAAQDQQVQLQNQQLQLQNQQMQLQNQLLELKVQEQQRRVGTSGPPATPRGGGVPQGPLPRSLKYVQWPDGSYHVVRVDSAGKTIEDLGEVSP
jgi:hypothetical protein